MVATYGFTVETGISLHIEVEANSYTEAIDKAKGASIMSLCRQCARSIPGEWSTSGEIDGDPASSELADAWIEEGDEKPLPLDEVREMWGVE